MIEYANDSVIKLLKQYDMLAKSLNLIGDITQKNDICQQMTKIIEEVIDITNSIYENKYKKVANSSVYLMDDERNRLLELINLISERRTYVNNQVSSNQDLTGIMLDTLPIMGEEKIDEYKARVKLIERYKSNIREESVLKDEISKLEITIKRANNKISNNKNLNRQLEERMIRIVSDAFQKLSLSLLRNHEKEIDLAYTELGYSLEKARENLIVAKRDCSDDVILECESILRSTSEDYEKYKEKKLLLKLMGIYRNEVHDYDELLAKREEIHGILSNITHSEFYMLVGSELNKEYASIKLEAQDAITLDNLIQEREFKIQKLKSIQEEIGSNSVQGLLSTLLENERHHQEKLEEERKKKEAEKRAYEKVIEQKRREEMLKRQKILEEERNREIEIRTKQLLDEKKNSVIGNTIKSDASLKNVAGKKVSTTQSKIVSHSQPRRVSPVKKNVNNDFFSRKVNNNSVVHSGIPVVKSNKVVDAKKEDGNNKLFPDIPMEKKDSIFPDIPNVNNSSFFDESEFNDLSNYMEGSKKKNWF